ncbi:hypothetical protein B0T19DRAFT_464435 [Cercophora scortea]|uniref:Uncharacterized protein n=1 Tax=Cercophora scortea TaxID=314031 RepID=A0AAE0MAY4_9PEZI|nr:hypothetical protein B0T19DRAFT_464435 [Cercophora scortea]
MSKITDRSRTILGPLTTTFTPSPACTVAVALCKTCNVAWLGQTCVATGAQDATECWPPTSAGAPPPSATVNGWGFYSPGTLCPSGYASACTATAGAETPGWDIQFKMLADETAVGCCPSGYTCGNLNGQTCVLSVASTVMPTVTCRSGVSDGFDFMTLPADGVNVFAPMIQINFKSSDLASDTQATSTTGTTTGTTSVAITSQTASPVAKQPAISTGAIAGIAIGAALLVIGIIVAAILVWRKKRRGTSNNIPLTGGGLEGRHAEVQGSSPSASSYDRSQDIKAYYAGRPPPAQGQEVLRHYYYGAPPQPPNDNAAELGGGRNIHLHEAPVNRYAAHEAPGHDMGPRELPG